jgi:hypothetical protein
MLKVVQPDEEEEEFNQARDFAEAYTNVTLPPSQQMILSRLPQRLLLDLTRRVFIAPWHMR